MTQNEWDSILKMTSKELAAMLMARVISGAMTKQTMVFLLERYRKEHGDNSSLQASKE